MQQTREYVKRHDIGPGADLVVVGLFTMHHGTRRNLPIVRRGTLASLPHEPLRDEAARPFDAYIAEVISIGGLSGSPVFVGIPGGPAYLLGIIRAHWYLRETHLGLRSRLNSLTSRRSTWGLRWSPRLMTYWRP